MGATNKGTPRDCRSLHEGTNAINIIDSAFIRMNTDWSGYYKLKKKGGGGESKKVMLIKTVKTIQVEEELFFTEKSQQINAKAWWNENIPIFTITTVITDSAGTKNGCQTYWVKRFFGGKILTQWQGWSLMLIINLKRKRCFASLAEFWQKRQTEQIQCYY